MRPLAWLLIHWPNTVALAGLERRLTLELDLRARCAAKGHASPHQLPPSAPELALLVLILSLVIFFLAHK